MVLLLWYDACEVPVSFTLGKMDGLQYGESSTEFILEGVDGFGSYATCDLVMAFFWATSISYAPFLDNFDDLLAFLLMEM